MRYVRLIDTFCRWCPTLTLGRVYRVEAESERHVQVINDVGFLVWAPKDQFRDVRPPVTSEW